MDQSSYMPVTPVLPGDMEGLRLVRADAQRVTHPLFVIVKPRKRDSDLEGSTRVKHWVRNLAGQPQFAFWLPTSTDYFYPDFVCELDDGRMLVVEYEGEHLVASEMEKRQVGEVWARTSGGTCLFLMAVKKDAAGRDVRAQIEAVMARS